MNDKDKDRVRSEQERLLDEALEETFPASDPISMQQLITVGRVEDSSLDGSPRLKLGKRP